MGFKTLTIKESTYRKISRWKTAGESFSELLDREFDRKIDTAADLLKQVRARKGVGLGLRQRKSGKKSAT